MTGSARPAGRSAPVVWALLAIVVIGAVVLVSMTVMKGRADAAAALQRADSYTPPPLTTPTPIPAPVMAVIGDATVSQAEGGVPATNRWTGRVSSATGLDVRTYAVPGGGYVTSGDGGQTFLGQVSKVPTDAEIVVVFGGAADADVATATVSSAAAKVLSAIQRRAPRAAIAIVGPVVTAGASDGALSGLGTALQSVSNTFDVPYYDPRQQTWLSGDEVDAGDLSAADQLVIAQRMTRLDQQLVPSLRVDQ